MTVELTSIPFNGVFQIIANASMQKKSDKRLKWSHLARWVEEVLDHQDEYLTEEERSQLHMEHDESGESRYHKVYRSGTRKLKEIYGNILAERSFLDVVLLLKAAIRHNIEERFGDDAGSRNSVIRQIEEHVEAAFTKPLADLKRNKKYEAALARSHSAVAAKPLAKSNLPEEVRISVKVTREMEEIYKLFDLLNQVGVEIPDYVDDRVWDPDYEKLIAVRKTARMLLRGQQRDVAVAILEAPASGNALVIRFGSDYWLDAEDGIDCVEDALFVEAQPSLAEAAAFLLAYIDGEDDLKRELLAGDDEPGAGGLYETRESLGEKLTALLA